jgi:positive regulator of sigma E activity
MKGTADFKSSALVNKSKKLQSKKSNVDRLFKKNEPDLAEEKFTDLELEYEQSVMSSDRIYLVRVFPLFILFIGLFLIFVDMIFDNQTHLTLYIGIFVTLCGLAWKLIMYKIEKKRKQDFLFGK